ncbi:DUF2924 domain-containing protein [Limobrevibacterium gyesilva]|nr:DUF2924 domain-containing protein [Limobrevibacterium gyesilva]
MRDEIARLAEASTHDLRIEWRRTHRTEPPASLSRDLLLRALAYALQERAQGGLNQTTKRMLAALSQKTGPGGGSAPGPEAALKPGVRLVREWRGEAHAVLVLEGGYEYQARRYRSLTQIAKLITGAHWSGPRFFGIAQLPGKARQVRPAPSPTAEDARHGQT